MSSHVLFKQRPMRQKVRRTEKRCREGQRGQFGGKKSLKMENQIKRRLIGRRVCLLARSLSHLFVRSLVDSVFTKSVGLCFSFETVDSRKQRHILTKLDCLLASFSFWACRIRETASTTFTFSYCNRLLVGLWMKLRYWSITRYFHFIEIYTVKNLNISVVNLRNGLR